MFAAVFASGLRLFRFPPAYHIYFPCNLFLWFGLISMVGLFQGATNVRFDNLQINHVEGDQIQVFPCDETIEDDAPPEYAVFVKMFHLFYLVVVPTVPCPMS